MVYLRGLQFVYYFPVILHFAIQLLRLMKKQPSRSPANDQKEGDLLAPLVPSQVPFTLHNCLMMRNDITFNTELNNGIPSPLSVYDNVEDNNQ